MIFETQQYQQDCINNIIALLKNFDFDTHSVQSLQECFKAFYTQNPQPIQTLGERKNIDVLMETGTGKTFTYLNTIFELHKHYFQNKFIIFVPRKAIAESVKQNINLTKEYFYTQYSKHLKAYYYNDEKSLSQIINGYIKNEDELSVLILTNSSIDKGGEEKKGKPNLLRRQNEKLFNNKTILDNIIDLKPICFIDEPHLLKGEEFDKVFQSFQTLYFRFGATFPTEEPHNLSNLVYCLDSISAFREYLVKQINVHTLYENTLTPKLISSHPKEKYATFSYVLENIARKASVFFGEDIGEKLHYPQWKGKEILRGKANSIILSNSEEVHKLSTSYELDDSQLSNLIAKAIDLHFEKEEKLFKKGIKALCLFFIPHIDDFRGEIPRIKTIFEKLYIQKREQILANPNLSEDYKSYLAQDFNDKGELCVAEGYFSGDKGTKDDKEAEGVKLILEEKEKLLSIKTPLKFIFSVWALQEGWDNPNIFTLVKLASSATSTSRHQQIGRGLRLAVNQEGKRITYTYCNGDDNLFYDINALDVLISGEEGLFIEELQKEIEDTSFVFNHKTLHKNILCSQLYFTPDEAEDFIYHLRKRSKAIEATTREFYKCIKPIHEILRDEKEDFLEILREESYLRALDFFKPSSNKRNQTNDANRKKLTAGIKKELAEEFFTLWKSINQKAQIIYKDIQTKELMDNISRAFNSLSILPETTILISKTYNSQTSKIENTKEEVLSTKLYTDKSLLMNNFIEFAKSEKLPLSFLLQVYQVLDKNKFFINPKQSFQELKTIIQDEIHSSIIQSISYDFIQTQISSEDLLYDLQGKPKESILCEKLGRHIDEKSEPQEHYLYDKVVYDSQIELTAITQDPKHINDLTIQVYAKLPKFSIPTPYKNYEPDFAYLINTQDNQKIFLVCETKGYESERDIPPTEQKKIDYAKKFFQKLQEHLGESVKICFKTRINRQDLINLLQNITIQGEQMKGENK
ncbi:DEAD/DEAH box helicase family protein [Helicobacter kayseriensis]|uniref:restriction endonuclease n=1 Tax=Helicobacter kayseriensis TaxID=2905877 RepID=UPI001E36ED94|nr:DEAD/DEAH box helicase family protein [Helicobacter kayseriensis]MCE3046705.1 DEAD/DEAH box helicase family protein [Helicobacter kayseriensis]MCE3047993.1 DEAD/DEAH box helicase family protein [Helicobacter kayseriensis]